MEDQTAARLARVIEARSRQISDQTALRARRAEHHRIVAEVPRFLGRLSNAIGEVNDRLSAVGLILAIVSREPQNAAEASFRIVVKDDESEGAWLDVTVEGRGRVHSVIADDTQQRAIAEADVFTVSYEDMIDWLIALLEARYLDGEREER